MAKTITVKDSSGGEREVADNPENIKIAKDNGFTIDRGFVSDALDFQRGAMEGGVVGRGARTVVEPTLKALGVDVKEPPVIDHSGKITVIDFSGGKREVKDNPENRKLAEENGFKIASAAQVEAADILSRPEYQGARGAGNVLQNKLESEYFLGAPEMARKTSMSEAEKLAWEQMKEDHPFASAAGTVGGIAASLATPGLNGAKVAKWVEQGAVRGLEALGIRATESTAAKAATIIAKEGAAGVAYSAPRALAEGVINKDPKAAVEHLGVGLGVGLTFGLGRFGLGQLAEKLTSGGVGAIDAAGNATSLPSVGEKMLADQAGLKIGQQADMPPTMINDLVEAGVFKGTKKEIAENILNLAQENGPKIGGVMKSLDKGLLGAMEKEAPGLGEVHGFNFNKAAAEISALGHGFSGPLEKNLGKIVEDSANQVLAKGEQFANKEGSLPFEKAQELKVFLNNEAKWDTLGKAAVPTAENNLRQQIATIAKTELENAADRVATASGDAKLISEWGTAKNLYKYSKQLESLADKTLNSKGTSYLPDIIGLHSIGAGMVGHAIAPGVGGLAAGFATNYAKKILANAYKEYGKTQMGLWLMKRAASDDFASYLLVDASAAGKARINQIPEQLKNLTIQGTIAATTHDPIKKILGEEASGLSKEQQFNKLSSCITQSQADPAGTRERLDRAFAPIAEKHLAIADGLKEDSLKKMEYIYNILPKNPDANKPFVRNEKWKPTKIQLNDFNKQLAVADDPFHVISELKAGTLTSKQVATLSYLNPEILQAMRDEVAKIAYSGKAPDLTYQQKLQVSLLMGQSMVKSLDYIQPAQAAYQGFGPVDPGAAGPPPTGRAPKMNPKSAEKHATLSQRLNGK